MTSQILPDIKPMASIALQQPDAHVLDNGIEVFAFNGAANDIIKLNVIFDAGRWEERQRLSSSTCAALIKSGSRTTSAFEIEESIDFLGSTIKATAGYNHFTLSLYCMTRHLESSLEIFSRILRDTVFPEHELELHRSKGLSRLKVNQMKNDYVGDMIFRELLFGSEHPYGYQTTAADITALTPEHLAEYYNRLLTPSNCIVGLAGKYAEKDIELINRFLGQEEPWAGKGNEVAKTQWEIIPSKDKLVEHSIQDSVQASINIGGHCIGRKHPDFFRFALMNMVFGGYFGSRLMKNIREEKGLTYGIYSYMHHYKNASALIINTDTAIGYVPQCLDEIYREMERLRQEKISQEELDQASNYMTGRLLDRVDGPFNSASTFLGLRNHGLDYDYVTRTEEAFQTITPDQLLETAQQYLNRDDLYQVVIK